MGEGGIEQILGWDCHHVAEGGGMAARGSDKLWPKCGEFYHYGGEDILIHCGVICTAQRRANNKMGGIILGSMPGADRYPPRGRLECPDRTAAG